MGAVWTLLLESESLHWKLTLGNKLLDMQGIKPTSVQALAESRSQLNYDDVLFSVPTHQLQCSSPTTKVWAPRIVFWWIPTLSTSALPTSWMSLSRSWPVCMLSVSEQSFQFHWWYQNQTIIAQNRSHFNVSIHYMHAYTHACMFRPTPTHVHKCKQPPHPHTPNKIHTHSFFFFFLFSF